MDINEDGFYVVEVNDKNIAYHRKKKVVKKYIKNYQKCNPKDKVYLKYVEAVEKTELGELYLEPVYNTYIQSMYVDSYLFFSQRDRFEYVETGLRQLLGTNLTLHEEKALFEVLEIIKTRRKECDISTPPLKILREDYWRLESMRNDSHSM